jgi:hypothetical protein
VAEFADLYKDHAKFFIRARKPRCDVGPQIDLAPLRIGASRVTWMEVPADSSLAGLDQLTLGAAPK